MAKTRQESITQAVNAAIDSLLLGEGETQVKHAQKVTRSGELVEFEGVIDVRALIEDAMLAAEL